jgi:hypothetical protein
MNVFGIFRAIPHAIKVGVVKAWHVIEIIGHDADVLFVDTLKAAQLLGYDKEHILEAVHHAEQSLNMYIEGKQADWTQETVATLQHAFVKNSLIEKLGLSAPVASMLTTIVSKLYATGSKHLQTLVQEAANLAAEKAGLVPGTVPGPGVRDVVTQ